MTSQIVTIFDKIKKCLYYLCYLLHSHQILISMSVADENDRKRLTFLFDHLIGYGQYTLIVRLTLLLYEVKELLQSI